MRTFASRPTSASLIGIIIGWWRTATASAKDQPSGGDLLLHHRMTALSINPQAVERVEPELFANLATLCRGCNEPKLCKLDLAHNPNGVAWEEYCPNAVVLNALSALSWFKPKGE